MMQKSSTSVRNNKFEKFLHPENNAGSLKNYFSLPRRKPKKNRQKLDISGPIPDTVRLSGQTYNELKRAGSTSNVSSPAKTAADEHIGEYVSPFVYTNGFETTLINYKSPPCKSDKSTDIINSLAKIFTFELDSRKPKKNLSSKRNLNDSVTLRRDSTRHTFVGEDNCQFNPLGKYEFIAQSYDTVDGSRSIDSTSTGFNSHVEIDHVNETLNQNGSFMKTTDLSRSSDQYYDVPKSIYNATDEPDNYFSVPVYTADSAFQPLNIAQISSPCDQDYDIPKPAILSDGNNDYDFPISNKITLGDTFHTVSHFGTNDSKQRKNDIFLRDHPNFLNNEQSDYDTPRSSEVINRERLDSCPNNLTNRNSSPNVYSNIAVTSPLSSNAEIPQDLDYDYPKQFGYQDYDTPKPSSIVADLYTDKSLDENSLNASEISVSDNTRNNNITSLQSTDSFERQNFGVQPLVIVDSIYSNIAVTSPLSSNAEIPQDLDYDYPKQFGYQDYDTPKPSSIVADLYTDKSLDENSLNASEISVSDNTRNNNIASLQSTGSFERQNSGVDSICIEEDQIDSLGPLQKISKIKRRNTKSGSGNVVPIKVKVKSLILLWVLNEI